MDILISAATLSEIQPCIRHLQQYWTLSEPGYYIKDNTNVRILITGVGLLAATYHLTQEMSRKRYDLAIQAGIAGSFSADLAIGTLVAVARDRLADLGAETANGFHDISELGFLDGDEVPYTEHWLPYDLAGFSFLLPGRHVSGITVNMVSGKPETIATRLKKYHPDIETMEGAALHYVCRMNGTPFVQIRSISNQVEIRDKSKWNIPLAIEQLNSYLIDFLKKG